jgi:hypothetical protein
MSPRSWGLFWRLEAGCFTFCLLTRSCNTCTFQTITSNQPCQLNEDPELCGIAFVILCQLGLAAVHLHVTSVLGIVLEAGGRVFCVLSFDEILQRLHLSDHHVQSILLTVNKDLEIGNLSGDRS